MDAVCLTRHARDDRFGGPLHTLFIGLQDPNGPFGGFGLLYKFNFKAILKQWMSYMIYPRSSMSLPYKPKLPISISGTDCAKLHKIKKGKIYNAMKSQDLIMWSPPEVLKWTNVQNMPGLRRVCYFSQVKLFEVSLKTGLHPTSSLTRSTYAKGFVMS